MGLLEKVLACSGPNTHFLVRTSCGKVLMNIGLGKFDVPAVCARRADLLAVLLTALPRECVRLGYDLKCLKQLRGKVRLDRKSTRLNSSHLGISYAVFCLT